MAPLEFEGEVSLEIWQGIAIITMLSAEAAGTFAWGTKREEHRWNPVLVRALDQALDVAESDPNVNVVMVGNKGKFWSNGMDLTWLDQASPEAKASHGSPPP